MHYLSTTTSNPGSKALEGLLQLGRAGHRARVGCATQNFSRVRADGGVWARGLTTLLNYGQIY